MKRAVAILVLWMLCFGWISAQQQHFPYNVSVQTISGHCYDDSHLIFTLTDDNGNIIQIDPQTHNAVNLGQYPLYNVQYHYQNVSGGIGLHYDYNPDIMLTAGTYCVGVTANVPVSGGGYSEVDTTFCNVQVTTSYHPLEASVLSHLANPDFNGQEMSGYHPSFQCADLGRIQLQITQGSFPYKVTILDEQQDTVRDVLFYHRVNSGYSPSFANYRDYYTFDNLPIGIFSIYVSDSCGYAAPPITFTIPDAEPARYGSGVDVKNYIYPCPDSSVIPFRLQIQHTTQNSDISWNSYTHVYFDSILQYRYINPGNDTTEWKKLEEPDSWYGLSNYIYDTLPSYCAIFNDTLKVQIRDLCHDTVLTFAFRFLPQFDFTDSSEIVHLWNSTVQDTCAVHLLSGVSTQTYKIAGDNAPIFSQTGSTLSGSANQVRSIPFRYHRCPLSYDIWSLPDSTLLGHSESNDFTGLGSWVTFNVDTSVQVHLSVTDGGGCEVAAKDTVFVYHPEPLDDLLYWFECHNDKDDDGKDHCCDARYLWIQEHGVEADIFRRNMKLQLIESPLYNHFNFTALRQEGVWNISFDDPANHSSYVEFSYPDGWRATLRDSVCLPPGRYTFEVFTDCGDTTITYEWAGYYWDSIGFTTAPQYDIHQECNLMEVTQVSTGVESYIYFMDPTVSNDEPIQENCYYSVSHSIYFEGHNIGNPDGNTFHFSNPGTYYIQTRVNNNLQSYYVYYWCSTTSSPYRYYFDTITVAFSYLDFETATAFLCDLSSTSGIVSAQAVNGNAPYTYTLYDQWDAIGNVIATNSTGFFDNVPMTVGQHFSVQVTDSCQTSFSVNVTAALLTHGSLVWEEDASSGPHCTGDTVKLTAMNFPPPATYLWSGPNGFSSTSQTVDVVLPDYSENGWYTVEILNSNICGTGLVDSILVPMAPNPQVTVTGDSTVCPGGSFTLQASSSIGESSYFWSTGDTTSTITATQDQATEYTVTATSPAGCIGTTSKIVEIQPPTPINNQVFLCSDSSTTLTAREADAYVWSTGATTNPITVSAAGIYRVTVTLSEGCSVVDTFKVTTVKVNGISNIDIPDICAGDTAAITVGHAASCNLTIIAHETILALNDTVFLPDGADCPPYGCSYQSSLHFAGYEDTAKVNSVDDIRYVRLNIEHSFAGDIYINITCPNGQKADILRWGDYQMYPDAHTYCASIISDNSKGWQSDVEDLYNASQGTRFGVAYKPSDSANPCDASRPDNAFGTGWNYCWSNNTSEGYTYAGGTGSLIYRECNAVTNYDATPTYYWSVPVYPKSFDSSNVAIGTQFYHPDESFDSLVGCPLNGDWYIEVMDGVRVDNGYIFGWELALAPDIQTIEYVDVVNTTVDGPWVTATSDSSFLFTPPANIDHDTTVSYTFHCHSQFGCGYDTVVSVTFHPRQDIVIDTTACNSLVWDGVTYTADTSFTDSFTNIHGCDSIITVNIHVITTPSVEIVGSHYFCPGDTVMLTAVVDGQAQYLWSNGETDSTITVTETGVFTVIAYFPGGCSAESDEFHLFEVENPILDGFLNDVVAGDTQMVVIGTVAGDNLQYLSPQYTFTYTEEAEQLNDTNYVHVSEIGFEGLWAENGSTDSTFVITPPANLANDTIVAYTFTLTDEIGCLFDTTIYIHIYAHKHTDLYDTVLVSELPHVWNGLTITHAGCSDTLLFTTHGADSVVTMHLSVIYPFDTTICTNAFPLSWHGHTFNAADTLTIPHPLPCGCDSIEVLTVTESPVYQDTSYVAICESMLPYVWQGQEFNDSGIYSDTLFTVAGCDSILVLNLHIEDVYEIPLQESICQGDTFPFFGRMLTQSGIYTDTLQTSSGCDSVIILNLTVNQTYNISLTVTICQGDSFLFFGQQLTEEGIYSDTMQTVAGCDSVITLNLVVNPTFNVPVSGTICQGDTFFFFGQQLTEAGVYTDTLQTVKGCDSVITLTLTVNPTYSIPVSEAICAGDTFDFHGESLTEAGVYTDTLQTVSGCDSIVVLNLSVNPVYHIPLSDTICEGDTLYFFSQNLTLEGIYTDTLQSVSGCDSIITLSLTVNPVYNIPLSAEICAGDTFLFFGQSLMTTGLYTDTLQTVNGCDSVISLHLTVNEATSGTIVINIVENDLPYEINQTSYDSAGTYIQHLTNAADCDSVLTIHLFVVNNQITYKQATICDNMLPASWQGHVWFGPGVIIDTFAAVSGADSIVVNTLSVGLSSSSDIYDTVLENDLPYSLNDVNYYATDDYIQHRINYAGCDSAITLHLTVLLNQRTELDSTVCDSLLPVVWNGITFTEAGVDSVLLEASNGVDSTVVMTLHVNASSDSMLIVSVIENNLPYTLNSFEYDAPGTYTQSLDNAIGCDSTLTLVLTVLYNVRTEVDSTVCDSLLPITWNGVEFTGAGTDSVLLTASTQVDSLVVMTLTVNYPTTGLVTDTVVQNNLPYLLNGTEYDTTGIYLQHLTNVSGCDSMLTLDLTVLYNVKTYLDSTVCDSLLPVHWNGITFTEAGTDTVVYQAANGADSIVVMTLNVNASSYNTLIVNEIENNLPYTHNGADYYSSGTYIQNLENALGCDSTLIIELTVLYNVRVEVDSTVCDSLLPITWNEVEFSGAGTDSVTILATSGVDSMVVMTVTIAYPTEGTFADTVVENSLPYQLNGYSYDSAGVYTQHLTNVNGCDSTLTFGLTVLYNVTSEADSAVCPNALPIVWNGKTFTAAGVQSAVLTAANGVDSTVTMTVTTLPSPTAHISGPSVLCADSYTTLTADSAVSYLWSNGMTTQSINVYASGSYSVTVTNELGCTASETYVVGNVVTVDPLTAINLPSHLCAGNSYTMTAGYHSTDNFVIGAIEETHSVAETVFLPDGIYCSPYGCSYQSPLTFTDFAAGATVTNVNDIRYVRLNMEHSFAGDIYINITCPNGQKADIMKYAGTGTSSCTGSIPAGSIGWQSGNNASQSTFFGMAYDYSTTSCNSSVSANAPGVGWNYCWSNNTDQGYNYAPGNGSLIYRSVNAHAHPYAYGSGSKNIFDSSNVAAGTQFYHPDQSFASLIGCPLNGSWYIEVVDGYSIDNGYLFGWELALASTFATTNNTEVVSVSVEGPWAAMTGATTFVISPPDTLQHDTLAAYTVHFYDENGCGYDTVVFLNVYVQSHIAFDTTVCNSFVWAGTTYTQSQVITWNGVNAHGCDSTVAINLSVYPNPAVAITGQPVACLDDTAHLVAACADTAALLVWSTGDTAQTITVTTAGIYTVTATNAGGCTSESSVTVAFSSPSQSTTDTTVCDSFLWNGTLYTQTGIYRDTLTNAAGCDSIATLNLTVNYSYLTHDTLQLLQSQLPYHFVPSDTTFAYGSPAEFQFSYTLPAQNGCDSVILEKVYVYMNYSQSFDTTVCASAVPLTWHGHTFTATATVTDSLHTVYGSDSVLTYTVTVDILNAAIGNVTHVVCYGDNTGAATATVTGGISPLTYQWTNGAGASVSTTTQISNRPAGDYTFTVTDAAGCSATASVTLNTLHGQMLPGTISGPQTLCFGDTLGTVAGTAATGDGCVYQWQISTDGTSWTPLQGTNNTQNYTFQTPVTGSFHLRRAWISTDCGTLYSDTLDISVWPVSSDTIYDDVCVGNPYNEHGFNISETETVGLGTLTSWMHYTSVHGCDSTVTLILDIHEPQETDISAEVCEGTGYYANGFAIPASETVGEDSLSRVLNLQTVDGCDSVVRLAITVIDTALRIVSPTADFCEDMSAELFVVTNMTDYEWSTGELTPNITVTVPGVYKVTASEGGCSVTARYVIEPCVYQLYLPNAITPARGDGLNDYFYIPELAKGSINLFEISVFNRWGEMVFYSTDKNFQWNGEYKGKIYHQTVYTYVIEYTDYAGRPFRVTGTITVL